MTSGPLTMTNAPLADDFWAWSLTAYDRPGVAEAALDLQDRHGANVNLLLACCWWAVRFGHALEPATLTIIASDLAAWTGTVTGPLRGVRRALKGRTETGAPDLRKTVAALELDAERIEQRIIARHLAAGPSAPDKQDQTIAARAALGAYAALLPQKDDGQERMVILERFINAVFVART